MKLTRLIITLLSLLSLSALADEPYPNRPINLIAANPPDVPTDKDLGFNTEYYIWAGLYAPSTTPPAVVKILRKSIQKAVANPQHIDAMKKTGILIDYRDAPEFKKFAYEDGQRMLKVIRAIGKID